MPKEWTEEEVVRILQIAQLSSAASLNDLVYKPNDEDSTAELGDIIPDDFDLQEHVENNDRLRILKKAIDMLEPRQQQVINLRFGLTTGTPMTLEEVAQQYGVTRERIRQVESKALQKLKIIIRVKLKLKRGDL